jgi:hypothetical protein
MDTESSGGFAEVDAFHEAVGGAGGGHLTFQH